MTDVLELLESTRHELCAAARELPEALACARPNGGWSAVDCLEHVSLVEDTVLERLRNAPAEGAPQEDKAREAQFLAMVQIREKRIPAPESMTPTGRCASLPAALESFNASRDRLIEFALKRQADLYRLALPHPLFGLVNGTELLVLVSAHALRHAAQVREVQTLLA